MPKSILIHNNNINLEKLPKEMEHLSFGLNKDVNNSSILDNDIDKYMSKFIETIKNEGNFDLIFIKDNLSENYLDLYGILLAYHIRLDSDEKMKTISIVIMSDLDAYTINLISPYAKILFTKNIYFIKNHPDDIAKMQKKVYEKALTKENFQNNFLNLITIESPASYTSHHSITNEWAIYRWADFLGVELTTEIQNSIYGMLYFKYLKGQHSFQDKKYKIKKKPQKPKAKGTILLIDDEYKKGWEDIFEKLLGESEGIIFETLNYEYKDKECDEICSHVINYIREEPLPDLIILDLRLCGDDFEQEKIENITGIKLIHEIHKINPAIQIILWTASGDSIILDEVNKLNILGYIKKESLGDRTADVNNSIKSLITLVDQGLEKKYLKDIWKIHNDILKLTLFDGISIEIKSVFEILDSNMKNEFIYAMFAIFKVIEIVNNHYFIDGYKKAIWRDTEKEISDNSSKNKILLILDKKLHLRKNDISQNIEEIIKIRNNTIHPKSTKIDSIDKSNILEWFKILQTILEKIDKDSK